MEKDSQNPGISNSGVCDLSSPTRFHGFCMEGRYNSPAYVKWDFDLPPVSEKIKREALELGRELKEQCSSKRRSLRRTPPYSTVKKKSNEKPPTKNLSYCRYLNKLKEALEQNSKALEDIVPEDSPEDEKSENLLPIQVIEDSASDQSEDLCEHDNERPVKIHVKEIRRLQDGSQSPDLFDDSFNEFMNECSQTVESNFLKEGNVQMSDSPPASRQNDQCSNYIGKTPKHKPNIQKDKKFRPRNLWNELDETDDDLFLQVDI